jgi:proteic killer suppression protein
VIASYADKDTEKIALGIRVRKFAAIARVAQRKLLGLRIAAKLDDLKVPPGNRLEALKDDREGQYNIRINDQCRICFSWKDGQAYDVAIVDYHS